MNDVVTEDQFRRKARLAKVREVFMNTRFGGARRPITHDFDYGDEASVGCQLKTRGDQEHFAQYAGIHDNQHTVLCYGEGAESMQFTHVEQFAMVDDMHARWMVD